MNVLISDSSWACFNSASLCLSLNNKRGLNDVAIIWRDEGCDALPVNTMTFKELRTKVWYEVTANESGVAIDMPMNVTVVLIYLAIVLAGYVVVSIADSFAPKEITTRLTIANAKAIFTQVSISISKFVNPCMQFSPRSII